MGISIDEKRVYDASEGPTPVYVAGEFGVARVDTSDDLVGEFGLAHRCTARDAAGRDGRLAVATDEDVLVGVFGDESASDDADTDDHTEADFRALGVGPAVAVGFADDGLVAAREDGTVVREAGGDWTDLGELADVRAIDGDLVAAASGVYRVEGEDLRHAGLDGVRDVAAAGAPLAATDEGLFRLGNGWMAALDGVFRAVSAADGDIEDSDRAHAVGADGLFAREDGEWREVELPVAGEVVALDHGEGTYAVTAEGTFLLSVGDGWHHQILGLRGVEAVAAP
ncbi:hypothetical protein M0R89_07620 [Halorussus limi]|uniref:HVO-0234-like beta-propeller domain-containing protein n=1 Tax=Halorussus limi TaxID=2938695 RepID=A0A8U0HYC0_9EURY|nr:hypothetical protein [Halorussus limi]UPV75917.1 hypothetical protein M0R89_07620 [Halorussus limi]